VRERKQEGTHLVQGWAVGNEDARVTAIKVMEVIKHPHVKALLLSAITSSPLVVPTFLRLKRKELVKRLRRDDKEDCKEEEESREAL
jgi:hypothetical protein